MAHEKPPTEEIPVEEDDQRVAELTESLARVQADYENYRRRTAEQREQERERAAAHVIADILQVVDNLELALAQAKEHDAFYKGIELVLGQLVSTLEAHGVERVPVEKFDPSLHEAILTEASKQPKGSIIEVLQPGYRLGDTVLRTAKVKLSKGAEEHS